jgi:hypothetical protein
MGKINNFQQVKLFIGLLYQNENLFHLALHKLTDSFGEIDFISLALDFSHTNYYENEMGKKLTRRFICFSKLWDVEKTAKCKLITNKIEDSFAENKKRTINLDPGILSLPNIILFTTKNFTHRIPLNNNIYGEVTLLVEKKKFKDLPWTYPDYKTTEYKNIFSSIREIYKYQLIGK